MSTRTTQFYEQSRAALREDTFSEIQRRLVAIHSVIAEATDDDRDIRGWSVQQLMQLMQDVDEVVAAQQQARVKRVG
jgi:hypothetical protein